MRLRYTVPLALLLSVACKSEQLAPGPASPANASEAAPATSASEAAPAASASEAAPAASADPAAAEAKEKERAKRLVEDWKKLELSTTKELARFVPELKAKLTKLVEQDYASGAHAVKAALASGHRTPGNVERDAVRHPVETLEFLGFSPEQSVFEYGPGAGWYTELLAPAVAKKGKLLVNSGDPEGPRTVRGTYYAARLAAFLAKSPEAYGKVEKLVINSKDIDLKREGTLDLALIVRGMHGMKNRGQVEGWLKAIHKALKSGGTLGVVQHRAAVGANAAESAKAGYLPEAWVIEQAKAAGFKLVAKSELNANPRDTKDYQHGVWTLPPSLRNGETEREKYVAIGESDRMTLRFEKL